MKNRFEIAELKSEANVAKDKLIKIMNDLLEINATREAKSLETLIIKLEVWQNK